MPAGQQAPLIVLLHPNGGSPFSIEKLSQIGVLAARENVIVALPPAAARGRFWDAMNPESPDEAYVVGLIDHLLTTLPIDPRRVFVAGFSMGAVLSERIACRFADRVAAVAIDAGSPWSVECAPTQPVSILIMHGTEDTTFPIEDATAMAEQWRSLDGCQGEPITTQLSPIAESALAAACDGGAAVQYVRYTGAIHQWFTNPDATELLWTFFQAHPRH
jgi:polyhydroxybutyrate depolymerase